MKSLLCRTSGLVKGTTEVTGFIRSLAHLYAHYNINCHFPHINLHGTSNLVCVWKLISQCAVELGNIFDFNRGYRNHAKLGINEKIISMRFSKVETLRIILGGATVLKCVSRGKNTKIHLQFNTPGNKCFLFPLKFEQDSNFTSTTLEYTLEIHKMIW